MTPKTEDSESSSIGSLKGQLADLKAERVQLQQAVDQMETPEPENGKPDIHALRMKLARLEDKSREIENEIQNLENIGELQAYRIFEDARNKMMQWVGVAVAVLTLFGLAELNSIKQEIRDKVASLGAAELVAGEVKAQLPTISQQVTNDILRDRDRIVTDIEKQIAGTLLPQVQSKAELSIADELKRISATIRQQAESSSAPGNAALVASAIDSTLRSDRYFVVAGSSKEKSDVQAELERVQANIGDRALLQQRYPGLQVCGPKPDNQYSALVIGTDKTLAEARSLAQQAIRDGFQTDTYPLRMDKAFFACPPAQT